MKDNFAGERIALELKRQNKSQVDLSQLTGLSAPIINNIIKGKYGKAEHFKKISEALKINPEYLLDKSCKRKTLDFDLQIHKKLYLKLVEYLEQEEIEIHKLYVEKLADLLYHAYNKYNYSDVQIESYIQGIIDYTIDFGTISKKSSKL